MIFFGKCKDLSFVPDNKRNWLTWLESNDGKKVVIDINLEKATRTLSQNSWLWGVVYKTIADSTGSTEDELHEIFKRMFLPPRFVKWKDREIKLPNTTTELSKQDFSDYVDRIRAEVASLGISIPQPDSNKIT